MFLTRKRRNLPVPNASTHVTALGIIGVWPPGSRTCALQKIYSNASPAWTPVSLPSLLGLGLQVRAISVWGTYEPADTQWSVALGVSEWDWVKKLRPFLPYFGGL